MILRGFVEEDFLQYREPAMCLIFPHCDLKCDRENGTSICQNSSLLQQPTHSVSEDTIINRYLNNPIVKSIVIAGLEPFNDFSQLNSFVNSFRKVSDDTIVIYTGYYKEEIKDYLEKLKKSTNIIVKFGRFIPGQKPHYDEVLGVNLASDNQYAERIC